MSRSLGHNVCSKSLSKTTTLQGLELGAIIAADKHTFMLTVDGYPSLEH